MRINRFYTEQTLTVEAECLLEDSVSHHMLKVLRFKPGMHCVLFNGGGGEYQAEFLAVEKKQAKVFIHQFDETSRESALKSHLAIAISKGDRMDWVMQKATELGVTEITPLYSEFSDVKLKADRLEKKMRHWQQVIVSACEQSERTRVPVLNPAMAFNMFCESESSEFKWVLHPGLKKCLLSEQAIDSVCLLVGPEGGFSDAEIELAKSHDFYPASLGPRILRTETAPVVALSILQHQFGDF